MNKYLLLGAVVVLCIIGALLISRNFKSNNQKIGSDKSMTNDEMIKSDDDSSSKDKMMTSKRYVEYSKSEFDMASKGKRVLFFYASWCPTCKPADESFRENEDIIPDDLSLIRVNYNDPETDNEEKDLAKKYGITYQHTFVQIDSEGNEITKWNGGQIDELLANIK